MATRTLWIVLLLFASSSARAQMPTEKPKGYVSDYAGVLSGAARERLEALSTELDQKANAQLAIVTVRSLEGQPIEEFSIALATKWGIGTKSKKAGDQNADRGVLLILAVGDRRDRIEVGYGLEAILPDGKVGGFLRAMTPYLRSGDYDSAMLFGASSIADVIAEDAKITLGAAIPRPARSAREQENGGSQISLIKIILILLILGPIFLFPRRGGGLGGFFLGGGGGGGGWSSGGGGGFGGFGGGSFGGGGSSGSW